MAKRVSQDEWDRRAKAVGAEWVEPVRSAKVKAPIRCLTCAREWDAFPDAVRRGIGCAICAGTRANADSRAKQAAAIGCEWTDPVGQSHTPTGIRCLTCGHEWKAMPTNVQQGKGCPECGKVKMGQAQRIPQERWDELASLGGCEWTERCTTSNVPTGIRCLRCGHEWKVRPGDVQQGKGCRMCAHNAPVSQEERRQQAARMNLEWTEACTTGHRPTACRCLTCGYEWKTRPTRVGRGSGCPRCAGQIVSQETRDAQAAAVGIEWTETVVARHTPAGARCLTCGYQWKAKPGEVQGGNGCPKCAGKRLEQSDWDTRIAAVDAEWLGKVRIGRERVPARCHTCGDEWLAIPESVAQGRGCPNCAAGGLNPARPALVYLLSDGRAAKVGVTNELRYDKGRLQTHIRNGWSIEETWEVATGQAAYDVEQAVIRWWRVDLELPPAYRGIDGATETVDLRRVSLGEIRAQIIEKIAALGDDV